MIIPFKAEHIKQIKNVEPSTFSIGYPKDEQLKLLEKSGMAYTAIVNDRIVGCGGVVEYWHDRGEVWAVFDSIVEHSFVHIHKATLRFLNASQIKRIEATVKCDFLPGHRWINMLGFKLEAPVMKAYAPSGANFSLYARVK